MSNTFVFHDLHPAEISLRDSVLAGLTREPKQIPPKFFYDQRGSELFEQICVQPEYYVTRVERDLLIHYADEIAEVVGRGHVLIEPGAGAMEKAPLLFEALQPSAFVPMDISKDYLVKRAEDLSKKWSDIPFLAVCADYSQELEVEALLPEGERLVFFPGSSLSNFDPAEANEFLHQMRHLIGENGRLLIGVDRKKTHQLLNNAYNDQAGVTAAFNLNLLARINRELNADFDLAKFQHRAFYADEKGRIEMHLVSQTDQEVRINGETFRFLPEESVHTESSYKYTPEEFAALAQQSSFALERFWTDDDQMFGLYLLRPDLD